MMNDYSGVIMVDHDYTEAIDSINSTLHDTSVMISESRHPLLDTPFEDYTVTEGLLLFLLLAIIIGAVIKVVKECFSWLR